MTEAILRISGIAVIGVIASLLMKDSFRTLGVAAVVCAAVIICLYSFENGMKETVDTVKSFARNTVIAQYTKTMLKALAIGYITCITGDICRDAGEGGLAACVELSGKVQLLFLSLPLVSSLLDIASQLL